MRGNFIILFLVFTELLRAQAPHNFNVTRGGDGIDIGYGLKETFNRNYIIIGSTTSFGFGSSDAYLILVDSMGNTVWNKTFGGSSQDMGKSVIVNPTDSGFVFVGYTNSFGNGGFDIYVVRTDKDGGLKWQSSFGGFDWDFGNDLILSSDGNIIVCGSSFSSGYGKNDGIILKINMNTGALIWQKNAGGAEDDEFQKIIVTSDGYYTLGGNTKSYGDLNSDFWLFKINNSGDSIRSINFGNSNKNEKFYGLIEDSHNKLVFCGSYDTSFYNTGKNIAYMIRTDLNGNFIDDAKNAGAFTNDDKYLAIANDENKDLYFLSRYVNHVGPYGIDIQPYLQYSNLVFFGSTTYGGFSDDVAFDVITTSDHGYAMVGYSKSFNLPSEDVFLLKLDSAIYVSESIVGLKKELSNSKNISDLYYYDGKIFLQELKNNPVKYEILNSNGINIQSGKTDEGFIEINDEFSSGLYIIRLNEYGISKKFIKH